MPQTNSNNTVKDTFGELCQSSDFYPLQRKELIALKKAGIIKNTAYTYLALRFDSFHQSGEFCPQEFAKRWGIAESTAYAAIVKLKEAKFLSVRAETKFD
jgi:hypothetical protein